MKLDICVHAYSSNRSLMNPEIQCMCERGLSWKKDKTNCVPLFQLLGDYDKVKTESSGSDCVCRCVVRPIKRSDCSHIHESDLASAPEHFYTVETITKGTDCKKCVCMAPPSAVNPCEGEYRFKKLQEASKDDIKVETHRQFVNIDATTVFLLVLRTYLLVSFISNFFPN